MKHSPLISVIALALVFQFVGWSAPQATGAPGDEAAFEMKTTLKREMLVAKFKHLAQLSIQLETQVGFLSVEMRHAQKNDTRQELQREMSVKEEQLQLAQEWQHNTLAQLEDLIKDVTRLRAKEATTANLEGEWVGREVDGPDEAVRMSIRGKKIEYDGAREGEWYKGEIALLDIRQDDARGAFLIKECPFDAYVGKKALVIFELDGDRLTMAGNEPGHPEFPTGLEANGLTRVFEFERE